MASQPYNQLTQTDIRTYLVGGKTAEVEAVRPPCSMYLCTDYFALVHVTLLDTMHTISDRGPYLYSGHLTSVHITK